MMKRLWLIAQFALVICMCAGGCGGAVQGGSTSSGDISLSVTITGLPSGAAAGVSVTGPAGYNQQLTSTQTLEVSQGTYTVTAKPVTQGGAIYQAATVVQTVAVSASAPGSVGVQYADLSYTYMTIDYPGAIITAASGINNTGQIVGTYTDSAQNTYGFIYSDGAFTSFSCPVDTAAPGSVPETEAYGINDNGKIVGTCASVYPPNAPLKGGFDSFGYLYDNGVFTNVGFPNSLATFPFGINANDTVVGYYENSDTNPEGDAQGFTYNVESGGYTTIDYSGAADTEIQAINSSGLQLGYAVSYNSSGSSSLTGFTYSGGQFSILNIAGVPGGFNNFDQIVGYYYSSWQSFQLLGGVAVPIQYPNSIYTFANGINDNGKVVGYYKDQANSIHGFVANPVH